MNARQEILLTGLLVLGVWAVTPARAQETIPTTPAGVQQSLADAVNNEPYHYSSAEGSFQVIWPSGCGKLRIRENEPNNFVGEEDTDVILVHVVVCDRDKRPGDGCSVMATFEAHSADGGPAGPEQVLARVKNSLKKFGVKVVKQSPIKRQFEDDLVVEGLDVFGTGRDGEGQFWVRGLLSYHDIYILTAWSAHGRVWDDPEYLKFFNGFVPYVE